MSVVDDTSRAGDLNDSSVAQAVHSQARATRNLWVLLGLSVAVLLCGSVVHIQFPDAAANTYIVSSVFVIPPVLVLVTVYALVVVAKFVSPRNTMRTIGGRSWAYKLTLVAGVLLGVGAFAVCFDPLIGLVESAGVRNLLAYGFPASIYLAVAVLVLSVVSLALRVHAAEEVPGSKASLVTQATADNLPDAAVTAVREVMTRISGETDSQRVARVSPFVVDGRVDRVLDRIGDRDTTLVSVVPFNLEAGEPVKNTVQVGGHRLIAADGCESVTYTLCWVADMAQIDGKWRLYGVRGAENQG